MFSYHDAGKLCAPCQGPGGERVCVHVCVLMCVCVYVWLMEASGSIFIS